MVRGTHTFTFGTHNEFFKFRNLFIRDNFGTYEFASLDKFEAGVGAAVRLQLLADRRPAASRREFKVHQLGFLRRRSVARRGRTSR